MADALAAAGMLLAALALVYTVWTPTIDNAIRKVFSADLNKKDKEKDEVRSVRLWHAAPIAAACWLILTVFTWRDLSILTGAVTCIGDKNCRYDDVAAIFLVTQLVVFGLALHATGQVRRLSRAIQKA